MPSVSYRWIMLDTARRERLRRAAISVVPHPASACAKIYMRCASDNSPPGIRLREILMQKDLIWMELFGGKEETTLWELGW